MEIFVQQFINALSLGGTYALLALGLAMVFSVLGLINFAHGELMTITGYAMFFAIAAGIPFPIAVILGIAAATAAAILMERVAFRPVRDANTATMLLTSFAVSTILHMVFQNFISARPKAIPVPDWMVGSINLAGIGIGVIQALSITATTLLLVALTIFLRRSTLGIAMRAASLDFPVTRLMGINANAVIATAFGISGLLAGVAGVLWLAQRGSVDPLMGFLPVLKAFIAVVLGGLGSLSGAVLGGFVLAFIEVSLRAFLPEEWLPFRESITLTLVIMLLLVRPEGLLGRKESIR
ncbi:MAG: branched-chain amino acid ABC transporter permease [Rhodospirillaceae bacterium]|nr:branched-chain amino acid ABC transporter permease [Rhodospirillaceae bacterium]MBT6206142.1 branched-chain amino acid ABC transporter permease [Rhodospirillaceae bacterium]MBT6512162.1 branched-chain amino acid ABC transporter permease [Rhodospirillaceae bacterium]MBT7646444.1 branched-chain amino acid ABC transporter permease [Rhodospirillaceae bacterium]